MASNLLATASTLRAMASNLLATASTLRAMASTLRAIWFLDLFAVLAHAYQHCPLQAKVKALVLDMTSWLVVNRWSFLLSKVTLAPHWKHAFIPLEFAYCPRPHGAHSARPSFSQSHFASLGLQPTSNGLQPSGVLAPSSDARSP